MWHFSSLSLNKSQWGRSTVLTTVKQLCCDRAAEITSQLHTKMSCLPGDSGHTPILTYQLQVKKWAVARIILNWFQRFAWSDRSTDWWWNTRDRKKLSCCSKQVSDYSCQWSGNSMVRAVVSCNFLLSYQNKVLVQFPSIYQVSKMYFLFPH